MDVCDAIAARKSVRAYLDKPVEEEKLNAVLEAARLAPSASNRQEWRFVIVREKEARNQVAMAAGQQLFIAQAPVIIAACAETDGHIMTCGEPCYPIDVAIALDHLTLRAVELGLGTCWIGKFNADEVKKILGIPDEIKVVQLMPLGYPVEPDAIQKKRRAFAEIVKLDHW
ncbi:MAG: nitroreductase [Anaerolineae bacterium]|nr:nitroreductase [Anaerolineae bacterium]